MKAQIWKSACDIIPKTGWKPDSNTATCTFHMSQIHNSTLTLSLNTALATHDLQLAGAVASLVSREQIIELAEQCLMLFPCNPAACNGVMVSPAGLWSVHLIHLQRGWRISSSAVVSFVPTVLCCWWCWSSEAWTSVSGRSRWMFVFLVCGGGGPLRLSTERRGSWSRLWWPGLLSSTCSFVGEISDSRHKDWWRLCRGSLCLQGRKTTVIFFLSANIQKCIQNELQDKRCEPNYIWV